MNEKIAAFTELSPNEQAWMAGFVKTCCDRGVNPASCITILPEDVEPLGRMVAELGKQAEPAVKKMEPAPEAK